MQHLELELVVIYWESGEGAGAASLQQRELSPRASSHHRHTRRSHLDTKAI